MMTTSISRSVGLVGNQPRVNAAIRSMSAPAESRTGFALPASTLPSSSGVVSSKASQPTSGLGFDFDFSFNNVDHTQAEYNAYYAEGAKKISESQGLPAGQYDFRKMSAQQAHIIAADMIVNGGKSPDDVMGLQMVVNNATWYGGIESDASKEKINILDTVQSQANFERSLGNFTAENFLTGTLSILLSNQKSSRLYDGDISKLTQTLKIAASRLETAR